MAARMATYVLSVSTSMSKRMSGCAVFVAVLYDVTMNRAFDRVRVT